MALFKDLKKEFRKNFVRDELMLLFVQKFILRSHFFVEGLKLSDIKLVYF